MIHPKAFLIGATFFAALQGLSSAAFATNGETIQGSAIRKFANGEAPPATGSNGEVWIKVQGGDICQYPDQSPVPLNLVKANCPKRVVYSRAVEVVSAHPNMDQETDALLAKAKVVKVGLFGWTCDEAIPYADDMQVLGIVDNEAECARRARNCNFPNSQTFRAVKKNGKRGVKCIGVNF